MSPDNPKLQSAERNLAHRYAEVKELASMAERLGLNMADSDEEEESGRDEAPAPAASQATVLRHEADEAAYAAEAALANVHRLKEELDNCMQQLRMVDGATSESVARHPAFRRMRSAVRQKMEMLNSQLIEARALYEQEVQKSKAAIEAADELQQEEEAEMDLEPMLRATLDNLWQRPYDCRVFTLQLLQALAELDDRSVCMMSSCFARYLEKNSAPANDQ